MTTASVTEFKANVSAYLRQVEEGQEVVITNHGKIRARVIPEASSSSDGRAFLKTAEEIRGRLQGGKDDWTISDYIQHGRR